MEESLSGGATAEKIQARWKEVQKPRKIEEREAAIKIQVLIRCYIFRSRFQKQIDQKKAVKRMQVFVRWKESKEIYEQFTYKK